MAATRVLSLAAIRRRSFAFAGVYTAALVAAFLGSLRVRPSDVDGYGLVAAMPVMYWVGAALAIVASIMVGVDAAKGDHVVGFHIPVLWIGILHTAPAFAADNARFVPVYQNLGLVRSLSESSGGDSLPESVQGWPGFYGSLVPVVAGLSPTMLDGLLRLWPTIVTAILAVLTGALARRAYPAKPLIAPLSALVLVAGSWMGQDYFSPLSVALVGPLAIIVVLESGPLRPRGSLSSVTPALSRFASAGGDRSEANSTASYVAMLIIGFAIIVSHPVAPLFVVAALVILGLHGRRVAWRLLLAITIAYLLWSFIVAEPWWSVPFDSLAVNLGGNWPEGLTLADAGSVSASAGHQWVTRVQIWLTVAIVGSILVLGGVMASHPLRHLRPALPLAPLALAPFVMAGLVGYGRGTVISVAAFALPMASVLVARALLAMPSSSVPVAVTVATIVMVPLFLMARFGNESFEMVTNADRHAVDVAYAAATKSSLLVADNPFLPWADRSTAVRAHTYLRAEPTTAWVDALVDEAAGSNAEEVVVVLTPSQSAWRTNFEGLPSGSLEQIGRWASSRTGVRVLSNQDGAWVLAIKVDDVVAGGGG
ncbi:MAG: hypothetical protein GY724_02480 [Actinomycetia bacterium]|nr:hypothetical protein [Actinomycetes bacterium]MCP5035184.1 hypothetical protein [Actinomycetes bacterium]